MWWISLEISSESADDGVVVGASRGVSTGEEGTSEAVRRTSKRWSTIFILCTVIVSASWITGWRV